jgi:hypothetical protein
VFALYFHLHAFSSSCMRCSRRWAQRRPGRTGSKRIRGQKRVLKQETQNLRMILGNNAPNWECSSQLSTLSANTNCWWVWPDLPNLGDMVGPRTPEHLSQAGPLSPDQAVPKIGLGIQGCLSSILSGWTWLPSLLQG